MSRNLRLYFEDIIEACQKIARYVAGRDRDAFFRDQEAVDAVLWNLQIIGEATKAVPNEIRHRYDSVPWRKVSGFRDVIVHAYFGIDEDILWDVVHNKLGDLEASVNAILKREKLS